MKCLLCGKENNMPLCDSCKTSENLDVIFRLFGDYGVSFENYPFISEHIAQSENMTEARKILYEVISEFENVDDYYLCRAYAMTYDDRLEDCAIAYLNTDGISDDKHQRILLDLLNLYQFKVFDKPEAWCEKIVGNKAEFHSEIYYKVAEYYAIVGEYDKADTIIDTTVDGIKKGRCLPFLYTVDKELEEYEKLKKKVLTYRTKRPYWPNSPEKRQIVAEIYDAKGIQHPRIELKPKKVNEEDFHPISEEMNPPEDYVSFWCEAVFSTVAKDIYELGAVAVEQGKEIGDFHRYIKPWSSTSKAVEQIKKESELKNAPNVDIVIKDFLKFAKDKVLIAPGALDVQAKLFTRACRYSGISKIDSGFFDLLDYADDMSESVEVWTREKLLQKFSISDGNDALAKAKVNVKIYDLLKEGD